MGVEEKMSETYIFEASTQAALLREHQRVSQPLGEKQDALALSWASYRKFDATGQRWAEWDSDDLLPVDHDMAAETRRYYRNRIAVQALKGRDITGFQQALYEICNGAPLQVKHKGMLCRLPYFYHEDIARDQLRLEFTAPVPLPIQPRNRVRLTPVSRIFKSRHSDEIVEYWFQAHDRLYMMNVKNCNPVRAMLDDLFLRPQLDIVAVMVRKELMGTAYLSLSDPVLAT